MSLAVKSTAVLKRDAFLFVAKIFTSIIVARKLGPQMLGIYAILSLIPTYAESFGRMKFDIAAVYFLGKQKYCMGETVKTLNVLALATSVIIVAVILWQFNWIYELLFSKTEYDATRLMYFILLQIPLQFLWMNYAYLIIHREDVVAYNRMIIINAGVSSMLVMCLLLIFDLGLWAVATATLMGTSISLIYGIAALGPAGPGGPLINTKLICDLFRFGSKLYAGGLIGHFQVYTTNLLTVLYLVPEQVAFFSLARSLGEVINRVPSALNIFLFPRLTKSVDQGEAARLAARSFRLLVVMLSLVGAVCAVCIYPVVRLAYGSAFLPMVLPFYALIPGIIVAGATMPFMQYMISINRADLGISLPIPGLAVQVGFALLFIPLWGPSGAALAFSSGLLASSLIIACVFLYLSGFTILGELVLKREDVRYLWNFAWAEIRKMPRAMKFK